jgi:hypothetical protein
VVFIISDFLDSNYDKNLSTTQRRHDTVAFVLEDPMEKEWPKIKHMVIEDAESSERSVVSTNTLLRNQYKQKVETRAQSRDSFFSKIGLDRVVFPTNGDYVKPLFRFFQEREKRFR